MNNSSTAMTEPTDTLQHDVERLKADIRQIRGDVEELVKDSKAAIRDGFRTTRGQLGDAAASAARSARIAEARALDQIEQHPFLAVGTALAVGALAGAALGAIIAKRN